MKILHVCLLCCLFTALSYAVPSMAAKRVALVIGNDSYVEVAALQKARGDALAIADSVSDQGFEVFTLLDATRRKMAQEFSRFTSVLEPGDVALLFFAGHGIEISGENFLLPVDISAPKTGSENFVKLESFALTELLEGIRNTGARSTLVFLDACRDNPFAARHGRSIGRARGLARIAAPQGTFIVYSAGAGQQALDALGDDDTNRNSVFTRLLLPKLKTPGLELRQLISELRVDVRNLALTRNHDQFPAYYDELLGEFYFADKGSAGVESTPVESSEREFGILEEFEVARTVGTPAALFAFIERYDDTDEFVVELARGLVKDMQELRENENRSTIPPAVNTKNDRKELIRKSQNRLNLLGCDAGLADGIAGKTTKRAFQKFLLANGIDAAQAKLGEAVALEFLEKADNASCNDVSEGVPVVEEKLEVLPAHEPDPMEGLWTFKASCPFFIKTTGSLTITFVGENLYQTKTLDSLGQTANGELFLTDREFSGKDLWNNGVTTTYSGSVSDNAEALKLKTSVGCKVTLVKP